MQTATDLVLVEHAEGVALVTLNRPAAMNALSMALCVEFCDVIAALDADPSVKVLVVTGSDDRAFCAGLDVKELDTRFSLPEPLANSPVAAIERCTKPVIAAINGVAMTGGLELALACDILIASEGARFADTHARVGLLPAWGLSQRLARTIGPYRARELSFSGRVIDAATAERWGLVNRVVAPEALIPAARSLAAQIASADPDCVVAHKQLINRGALLPLGEALALEQQVSTTHNRNVFAARRMAAR